MAFFVFSALGARGDVWPYLEIGAQLRSRGHRVVIATSRAFEAATKARDLEWCEAAPPDPTREQALRLGNPHFGAEIWLRDFVVAHLPRNVEQLGKIVAGADVLVSHTGSLAAPIVAQLERANGLKWVSSAVSPGAFLQNDCALASVPALSGVPFWGRFAVRAVRRRLSRIARPVAALRRELGVPARGDALWETAHSPYLELCLWPEKFAWSERARGPRVHCGFVPAQTQAPLGDEAREFLENGTPPVVFVAASYLDNEKFAAQSVAAASAVRARALLLGGPSFRMGNEVLSLPLAPLSPIFERASAIVHCGGIAPSALALRSGAPVVAAPHYGNQWDNALRLKRMGLAQIAAPYEAAEVARALEFCFSKFEFRANCAYHGPKFAEARGEVVAADYLEQCCTV